MEKGKAMGKAMAASIKIGAHVRVSVNPSIY